MDNTHRSDVENIDRKENVNNKRTSVKIQDALLTALEVAVNGCKSFFGKVSKWAELHFGDDAANVKSFFKKMVSPEMPLNAEMLKFKKWCKKFFGNMACFFSAKKRKEINSRIANKLKAVKEMISNKGFLFWFYNSLKLHYKLIGSVAIVCSIFVFTSVFAANASTVNAVAVICNGEQIGCVRNVAEFDESVRAVEERVSLGTNGDYKLGFDITYEFTNVNEEEYSTTSEMIDNILKFSGTNIIDAYGLYVDNELWGVCREEQTINDALDEILAPYKDKITEPNTTVSMVQDTKIVYGLYPVGLLSSYDEIKALLNETDVCKTYRVQADDTLESIAMMNNTTPEKILELNEGLTEELVVGSDINILNNMAKLSVKMVTRKNYQKTIKYQTIKTRTKDLLAGKTEVKQKGQNGLVEITSDFVYIDDEMVEEIIVEKKTIQEVVNEKVLVGTKSAGGGNGASTGKYMRPISGGYVSSKYGYRGKEFHTGVDFAAPKGTPIYAADGGTVVGVYNQSSGYGKHIIIQHSNGEQTLYGHCSALYVSVGEKVDKGQVIAAVGQTGRAYGYHLHFEVRRNGKHVYPGF